MSFTDEEVASLRSHSLARLATVSEQGRAGRRAGGVRLRQYERPDEFMELLRPDAVWVTAHGKRLTGWDEINAFTQRVLPGAMKDSTARYDVAHVLFVRRTSPSSTSANARSPTPASLWSECPRRGPVYVMVKERDAWMIAAGQNTQIKEP